MGRQETTRRQALVALGTTQQNASRPDVIIDPERPIERWALSPRGRQRMRAMLSQPWVRSIGRVLSSSEQKALDGAEQRGEVLEGPQRALLWDVMGRARTGERRIRAGLPPGTQVVDKTGTGGNGTATNDVGVVTLPGSAGHLAIAVLIAASSLPARAQEDLIAQIARTAFDSFIGSSRGAPSPP